MCPDYACWQKPSIFWGCPCLSNNQTWCHQVLDWISEIWSSSHGIYRSLLGKSRQNTTHQLWNAKHSEIWSQPHVGTGCCFFSNRKIYLVHSIAIFFHGWMVYPLCTSPSHLVLGLFFSCCRWMRLVMKVGGGPFKAKAPSKMEGSEVGQLFETDPKIWSWKMKNQVWKFLVLTIWWLWN